MQQVKILDESEIPANWYNVVADMPKPPAPLLGRDGKPVDPESLAAIFPPAIIEQEISRERWIPDPEPVREIYRQWRPYSDVPRASPGASTRDPREHLLQVRRRQPRRLAQAEHLGAAGILQSPGRRAAHRDRDRRRVNGVRRWRWRADVRYRGSRVHGSRQLRAEAVSALDDGSLGRRGHREPEHAIPRRAAHILARIPIRPGHLASRSPRRSRKRRRAPTPTTRSGRCSITCCFIRR